MALVAEKFAALELQLNASSRRERLQAVCALAAGLAEGSIPPVVSSAEVNNHVHTCYSFSPHSPSSAAWHAFRAGLRAVGIMDRSPYSPQEYMFTERGGAPKSGSLLLKCTAG